MSILSEKTSNHVKEQGKWTWWNQAGVKERESHFIKGQLNGKRTWWYDNGQKWAEGDYLNGEKQGEWIYYNEDGSIKSVETHKKESSEQLQS